MGSSQTSKYPNRSAIRHFTHLDTQSQLDHQGFSIAVSEHISVRVDGNLELHINPALYDGLHQLFF
jgi:hypothetical protein